MRGANSNDVLPYGRWVARLCAVVCLSLSACHSGDDDGPLSKQARFHVELGPDLTTAGAITADGAFVAGRLATGVKYSEMQDPKTGDVTWRGVSGTSMASDMVAFDRSGNLRWSTGFGAPISAPVIGPDGTTYTASGRWVYALGAGGEPLWKTPAPSQNTPAKLSVCPDGSLIATGTLGVYSISADGTVVADLWGDPSLAGRAVSQAAVLASEPVVYVVHTPAAGATSQLSQLTALGLDGTVLWTVDLTKYPVEAPLLLDEAGDVWVPTAEGTRVYSPSGALLASHAGLRVSALTDDGMIGRIASPRAVELQDRAGQSKWRWPVGRTTSPPVSGDDGRFYFLEDSQPDDLGSGDTRLNVLDLDGSVFIQQPSEMNTFDFAVAIANRTVFGAGSWVNQYPPFRAMIEAFDTHATGLAGPWPRERADNQGTSRSPVARSFVPDQTQVRGWWLQDDGTTQRTLWFGVRQGEWSDLAGQPLTYGIWQNAVGEKLVEVEAGTYTVAAGVLHLQPKHRADGQPGQARDRTLTAGDGWTLQLADPADAGTPRTWHRVGLRPNPPSPAASAGKLAWLFTDKNLGTTSAGVSLAHDAKSGGLVVAGTYWFGQTLQTAKGTVTLPNPGTVPGAVLLGLDASGQLQWADDAGGSAQLTVAPLAVDVDSQGNALALLQGGEVYNVSYIRPVTLLRRIPAGGGSAKVTSWRSDDATDSFRPVDLRATSDGGAWILGAGRNRIAFLDGGPSFGAAGTDPDTAWLIRVDAADTILWAARLDAAGAYAPPNHLALAADGSAWVAASSQLTVATGGKPTTTSGLRLWHIDPQGKTLWAKTFASATTKIRELDIAVDATGRVALAGTFAGSLDLGVEEWHAPVNGTDWLSQGFVAAFTAAGALEWARPLPDLTPNSVAFDAHGNLLAAGNEGRLTGPQSLAIYAAWDACGNALWQQSVDACDDCGQYPFSMLRPRDLVTDTEGAAFATGSFFGGVVVNNHIHNWYGIFEKNIPEDIPTPNLFVHKLTGLDGKGIAALPQTCGSGGAKQPVEVVLEGSGTGRVLSDPPGIDCPGKCKADFAPPQAVKLTATADGGSTFTAWSQDCTGSGTCSVAPTKARKVVARFDRPEVAAVALIGGQGGEVVDDAVARDDGVLIAASLFAAYADVDYGSGALPAQWQKRVLVGRYDAQGKPVWWHLLGGPGELAAARLQSDGAGGAWLKTAAQDGTITWDGVAQDSIGTGLTLLVHIGADGAIGGVRRVAGAETDFGGGHGQIALLTRDAIAWQGKTTTGLTVQRLDAAGAPLWSTVLGPGWLGHVATDAKGQVFVGWLAMDGTTIHVAAFAADTGTQLWTWQSPGAYVPGLQAFADGRLLVAPGSPVEVAGEAYTSPIVVFDAAGQVQRAVQLPLVPGYGDRHALLPQADGGWVVETRAFTTSPLDLGPPFGTITTNPEGVTLLRYTPQGQLQWVMPLSSPAGNVAVGALSAAPSGVVALTSTLSGTLPLPAFALPAQGKSDVILLRIAP